MVTVLVPLGQASFAFASLRYPALVAHALTDGAEAGVAMDTPVVRATAAAAATRATIT